MRSRDAYFPLKSNQRDPIPLDKTKYKWRNQIKRLFNEFKNLQRIATRDDKTKESYLGFVAIAAVKLDTRKNPRAFTAVVIH